MGFTMMTTLVRNDFSWGLYFFAQCLYTLGIATVSTTYRRLFFLPFAGVICYLAWFTTLNNAVHDYGMGTHLFTILFAAYDFLILTDLQNLKEVDGSLKDKNIRGEAFLTRIQWALKLQSSPRGLGWSFAVKEPCIPPAPSLAMSRKLFLLNRLQRIVLNAILYDLTGFVNRANPCFSQHGCKVSELSIREDGLRVLLWRYSFIGYGVASYLIIDTLHCVYASLGVGLGLSEPWQWPPLMGSFADAFTVKRFWGRVWHQMMRKFLLSITNSFAHKFGLSDQSRTKHLFQLFSAFLISAFIHYAGGDYMVFGSLRGGSFLFFSLQPFAIVAEELLAMLAREGGLLGYMHPSISRWLGYIWVATWFAYTVPLFVEPQLEAGFFENGLSFSFILGIWRGEWVPHV